MTVTLTTDAPRQTVPPSHRGGAIPADAEGGAPDESTSYRL